MNIFVYSYSSKEFYEFLALTFAEKGNDEYNKNK